MQANNFSILSVGKVMQRRSEKRIHRCSGGEESVDGEQDMKSVGDGKDSHRHRRTWTVPINGETYVFAEDRFDNEK